VVFLPIVERELRVAARKRSTFWLRIISASVALLIGFGFLLLTTVGAMGFGTPAMGRVLFTALTWLAFAAALLAGLFFTSDCLSEEKREGTLGFLFLTDLRGYDVVLGKLLATSLRSVYALLAVFPVLAVTLLMGGVTGGAFWKTALTLVNGLFLSLVVGLFVSALSRDSQKALAATLVLLAVVVAAGPACDALLAALRWGPFKPVLSLSSPGYLFVLAGAWGRTAFWQALLVNQILGWTLLALTCLVLPRTWQEKRTKTPGTRGKWARWWKYGGTKRQVALRAKLLGVDPVMWLACRERWQTVVVWAAVMLLVGGTVALLVDDSLLAGLAVAPVWWFVWGAVAGLVALVLYLGMASQAGRFFVEAKRNGLLELLLATPLPAKEIVRGQWRGLLRRFGLPLGLYLAAQFTGTVIGQQLTWSNAATAVPPAPPPTPAATNSVTTTSVTVVTNVNTSVVATGISMTMQLGVPSLLVTLALSLGSTLGAAADLIALAWFGMWMGLTSKSVNLATLKTIVFVLIIPWFAVSFASALVVPLLLVPGLLKAGPGATTVATWAMLQPAMTVLLNLAKDVGFWLWARRKLFSEFRERATWAVAPMLPVMPSPLPRPAAPPVTA
jgi:ABC-type transport system involved in cytochrome c biogenesis permease component